MIKWNTQHTLQLFGKKINDQQESDIQNEVIKLMIGFKSTLL
jgi:hypothetical protein